jgi:uncharacterized protein
VAPVARVAPVTGALVGPGGGAAANAAAPYLALADWRREIARLYAEWRRASQRDPRGATETFRAAKDELFREHPQSPLPANERGTFAGLRYWPYDHAYRMDVALEPERDLAPPEGDEAGVSPVDPSTVALPESHPTGSRFRRIGRVQLTGPLEGASLGVYWIDAYGGGIFLPFRDATAGRETYGAGRYLLDTIKGADLGAALGGDAERATLLLDFNMAYPPSCAYDPRWACPLAPPDTFVTQPIPAGERLLHVDA